MKKINFYNEIKNSIIEREVEDVYNKGINLYFPNDSIEHPFSCDGFIDTKTHNNKIIKLIIEYKYNNSLNNKITRAKILAQVIFYLKKFENNGLPLPNVCMVGDINECFVLHTNELLQYLDEDIDWNVAPSNAGNNIDFVQKISENNNINPFIFEIKADFDFKIVADKIVELAENIKRYVRVTEHNISKIFDYFVRNVITDKKINAHNLVGIFIGVITDSDNYFLHPSKKNCLMCNGKSININSDGFKSFFSYFDRIYTPQEKMKFSEIADRLIEDTDRRSKGDFWTPTMWVDYAHNMIEKELGENWRDEYVVWDNCCASKNLTRDYKFKELYCSTLFDSELEIGKRYNTEGTAFQFDFLNDYIPMPKDLSILNNKIPEGLLTALNENKPIVFFLNPPYGTAGNQDETSKKGINDTIARKEMRACGLGAAAENLQHQFMYRIMQIKQNYNLTNCYIALFSNPIYLTGCKQENFLNEFCNIFEYKDGILFQASNFANVSSMWGITFNIWKTGKTNDVNNFVHKCAEIKENEIEIFNTKNIYNSNNQEPANMWVRKEIKGIKTVDLPNLSNAINIKEKNTRGRIIEGSVGYFLNHANSVQCNQMYVALFSSSFSDGHGLSVTKDNYKKCVSLFSARKLIDGNWINDKDVYFAPNTNAIRYEEFVNDSIIYSLCNTSSNQSSLRNIEYKGKIYDIKNEFFFMSKNNIMDLANTNRMDETYNDVRNDNERYTYKLLQTISLSKEAKDVLDKMIDITIKTFNYRNMFNEEHPKYQIMNWDCGWYQIKALAKEYAKNDLIEFAKLYKKLSDKMKPMVYELNFLK